MLYNRYYPRRSGRTIRACLEAIKLVSEGFTVLYVCDNSSLIYHFSKKIIAMCTATGMAPDTIRGTDRALGWNYLPGLLMLVTREQLNDPSFMWRMSDGVTQTRIVYDNFIAALEDEINPQSSGISQPA